MVATARYRYILADTLTGSEISDLPLNNVSFDRRISRVGSFRGNLPVLSRSSAELARRIANSAGRANMWVYRNSRLWWGGMLWVCAPTQDARGNDSMLVQASTFDSYAHHRNIWEDLSFTNVDQARIMWGLWQHMQSYASGNIGVTLGVSPTTGTRRDRSWLATDDKTYGKAIEELGDSVDGPEHTIDVMQDGRSRRGVFRTGNLMLNSGRPILTVSGSKIPSFDETVDATEAGTHFRARGDALPDEDQPQVSNIYPANSLLQNGWPRLDVASEHDNVTSVNELNQYAQGERSRRSGQARSSTYEIYLDNDNEWHPNRIGDSLRVIRSKDDWWMESGMEIIRPAVMTVTPSERGKPESIKVTMDGDAD